MKSQAAPDSEAHLLLMSKVREELSAKTRSMYVGKLRYFTSIRANRKGDGFQDIDDLALTSRPCQRLPDGSSYKGQWNAQDQRDGYGL
jgi:hypothetical protein